MSADLLANVGVWSQHAVWLPVALWTAVAAPALLVLWLWKGLHPAHAYRLRQAILFALPLGVLLRPWVGVARDVFPDLPSVSVAPSTLRLPMEHVSSAAAVLGNPASPSVVPWADLALGLLTGVALVLALVSGMRLLRGIRDIRRLARALSPLTDQGLLSRFRSLENVAGLPAEASSHSILYATVPEVGVPMTFGLLKSVVVLPNDLATAGVATDLAVLHELVHVRRADYAIGLLERVVSAAFAVHPLVHLLRRSIQHHRETSCDAEVLSRRARGRTYGELLLSLARRTHGPFPVVSHSLTRPSNLRARMDSMRRMLEAPRHLPRSPAKAAFALAAALILVSACASGEAPAVETTQDLQAQEITSAFGPMADETRDEALRRLDVQMDYLLERIQETRASMEESGDMQQHVYEAYQLLNNMYLQRLETYEVLKLEAETERRLGGQ